MAWIIKGYWESFKIKLARLLDLGNVVNDLEEGGCHDQWALAMLICDRDALRRTVFQREHGEVIVPVDLDARASA